MWYFSFHHLFHPKSSQEVFTFQNFRNPFQRLGGLILLDLAGDFELTCLLWELLRSPEQKAWNSFWRILSSALYGRASDFSEICFGRSKVKLGGKFTVGYGEDSRDWSMVKLSSHSSNSFIPFIQPIHSLHSFIHSFIHSFTVCLLLMVPHFPLHRHFGLDPFFYCKPQSCYTVLDQIQSILKLIHFYHLLSIFPNQSLTPLLTGTPFLGANLLM